MDDVKQAGREVETGAKKASRNWDGEDLADKVGNAGDEISKNLGNAGDNLGTPSRRRRQGQGHGRRRGSRPKLVSAPGNEGAPPSRVALLSCQAAAEGGRSVQWWRQRRVRRNPLNDIVTAWRPWTLTPLRVSALSARPWPR